MGRMRIFLGAATLGLVAALLFTSLSASRRMAQASEMVVRGEAEACLRTLRAELRELGEDVRGEEMEQLLEPDGIPGLVHLALLEADGSLREEVGAVDLSPERLAGLALEGAASEVQVSGARALVVGSLGPRRGRRARRFREWRPAARRRPGAVVFEYRSDLAAALADSARHSLWVGGLSALVFLACAGWLIRLLEERAAAAERAARRERLASLGEMSAVLAHEIRNPLTSLKGHAQLLAETTEEQAPAGRKTARILGEVERLEALVNGLLDFVRAGAVERREVDPRGVLAEALELLDAGESVEVEQDGAPETWSLDPIRMRQVLVNLVQNALESGGSDPPRIRLATEKDRLVVEVADRGRGIEPGEEERIFEPFVTTRTQGTGLGLAVSRRLTELHGGVLRARRRPGGGALFRLEVPASGEGRPA